MSVEHVYVIRASTAQRANVRSATKDAALHLLPAKLRGYVTVLLLAISLHYIRWLIYQ